MESKWTIKRMPLDKMNPASYNPRKISSKAFAGLLSSVQRFGLVEPIIWNERTGNIVGGHQRYKVLSESGTEEIDVVVVDMDEADEMSLNVTLNNPHIQGEFTDTTQDLLSTISDNIGDAFQDLGLEPLYRKLSPPESYDKKELLIPFSYPFTSIMNAGNGDWISRKKKWKLLGIESEEGRDAECLPVIDSTKYGLNFKTGTSIFDPVLCEMLYRRYVGEGGVILDPFAGGSVRGVVAAWSGRKYTGIDLRPEQIEANLSQWGDIGLPESTPEMAYHEPSWIIGDSLNIDDMPEVPKEVDLVFTCPPYEDLEVYSDDERDLSKMDHDDFLKVYREIIAKACARLKENRFAVIVVGEVRYPNGAYRNFVGETVKAFEEAGLKYHQEAILVTPTGSLLIRISRQFNSGRKIGKTHQNVLIFVKGDSELAAQACGDIKEYERAE